MLMVRHRRSEISFVPHREMQRYILNLGLYQLATMPQSKIDQSLMHGLAERWQPETHTCHLPVEEMTVTLGDVSALWGLRIDDDPISGISDHPELQRMIPELLGCDPKTLQKKYKKKKKGEEEEFCYSGYCISLKALWSHFFQNQIFPETIDIEAVRRYTKKLPFPSHPSSQKLHKESPVLTILFLNNCKCQKQQLVLSIICTCYQ